MLLKRKEKPAPIAMANGKPARFRFVQNILGRAMVAFFAAALVAGLYFNITQVRWGPVYLKPGWDGLFTSPMWEFYRHGYRDQGEPLYAFLFVGTIVAAQKTWSHRAGWLRMTVSMPLLLIMSIAGITGGIYVLYVLLPKLPGIGDPPNHFILLGGTLLMGFILGKLIQPIWVPVGATINGWLMDRSVDRYEIRRMHDTGAPIPFWVRHWWSAPLQMRERWVWQREHNAEITARKRLPLWLRIPARVLTAACGLLVVYLVVTGIIAHFWIGAGHDFPFLAPPEAGA